MADADNSSELSPLVLVVSGLLYINAALVHLICACIYEGIMTGRQIGEMLSSNLSPLGATCLDVLFGPVKLSGYEQI